MRVLREGGRLGERVGKPKIWKIWNIWPGGGDGGLEGAMLGGVNARIASMIRHGLTALPALGGYLLALGWLTPDEAAAVDAGQAELFAVLAAVGGSVLGRLVLWAVARYAPGLQGILGTAGDDGPRGSGPVVVALLAATGWGLAAVSALTLSGCAGGDWAVSGSLGIVPVNGAKAGLTIDDNGRVTGWARGRIVDAETGREVGTGTIRIDRGSGK